MKKAVFFGFKPWARIVPIWFRDMTCVVTSRKPSSIIAHAWPLKLLVQRPKVFVWGFKYPYWLKILCRLTNIDFHHVEDGFVRSIGLGRLGEAPSSITVDKQTMYYDCTQASELENILEHYDFSSDVDLMGRAKRCLQRMKELKISKYNAGSFEAAERMYGDKTRKRVLVIGQVEGDASIRYGGASKFSNESLVKLAAEENHGAQIIYKPHPETTRRTLAGDGTFAEITAACLTLTADIAPAAALETIDHVYTMTSLMGFEALLMEKKVTCVGVPFYSGWGVTDDRQTCHRRTKQRSVLEIFAAAFLLYPIYFNPQTATKCSFEEFLDEFKTILSADLEPSR